jgi:hypothetical protein
LLNLAAKNARNGKVSTEEANGALLAYHEFASNQRMLSSPATSAHIRLRCQVAEAMSRTSI